MSVSVEQLENFIVKAQPDLETIKRELSVFNIFNVLGIQHREIRHSNFLGWLFDPNESHNLDDVFLKDLFKLMRKRDVLNADDFIGLLLQDLSDTQVYRESVNNIDILIVNEKLGLVICIENKINADYSDHQLEKYYNYVEENYNGLKTRVYLTLTPFKNEHHLKYSEGKNYTNINYKDIVKLLKTNKDSIDKSIPTIRESINQYIAMVEKSVIHSSDEVKLAQKIYKKYKNEIEFVIKNKPDFSSEKDYVIDAIKNGVLGNFDIIDNDYHTDIIRILPKNEALKSIFRDPTFQSWGDDYMFCLELFIQKNHIWLKWCFGDIRNNLERDICQQKKTRMVTTMQNFDCFKNNELKIDFHNGKPEDSYTGICGVNLFYYETYMNQDKTFLEFIKDRFDVINIKLIEPWVKECIKKLA
jgi:hypothetical protein